MKKVLLEKIKEEDVNKLSISLFFTSLAEAEKKEYIKYDAGQEWVRTDFYNSADFPKNRLPRKISQLLSTKFYKNFKNKQ